MGGMENLVWESLQSVIWGCKKYVFAPKRRILHNIDLKEKMVQGGNENEICSEEIKFKYFVGVRNMLYGGVGNYEIICVQKT